MKVPFKRSILRLIYVGIIGNIILLFLLYIEMTTMLQKDLMAETDMEPLQGFEVLNENDHANENIPAINIMSLTFTINPKNECSWNSKSNKTRIAVVVISKIDNFGTRYAIRRTWGTFKRRFGTLVFLIGTTSDTDVQNQLFKEAKLYNDIIQANVTDSYNMLTYKSIAMLQWLYLFCRSADFYMKADDNAYINIDNIVNSIEKIQERKFFFCAVFESKRPIRNRTNKWFVPFKQFDGEFYPTYCSGAAYVFPSSILSDLYKSALTSNFIAMEDIYITGISVQNLNITYINSEKFLYRWTSKTNETVHSLIEMHSIHVAEIYDLLQLHSMFT